MSDEGMIGLDPDATRDLAALAAAAGDSAGLTGTQAGNVISVAQLDGGDATTLCAEIAEELDLLARLLQSKATEMELAASGIHFDLTSGLNASLWASLTDGVGEGIGWVEPDYDDQGGIPLSGSVAARLLAQYLGWQDDDATLDAGQLRDLLADGAVPPELRAAALYFVANPEAWLMLIGRSGTEAGSQAFSDFATTNAALAVLAAGYQRFETAAKGDAPDGHLSYEDYEAIMADESGRFSADEKAAIDWLFHNGAGHAYAPWESHEILTWTLMSRQVFAEDPDLAVAYLEAAAADPEGFVIDSTWFDEAGATAWLTAALASTDDPARRRDILLTFVAVYESTKPEDFGPLDLVHGLLDLASWIDPTQLADGINAGIYVLEGDEVNAAISAGGILLPLGGGQAIRLTREAVLKLAAKQGDEAIAEVLQAAMRSGDLSPEAVEQMVKDVADQFGDDVADALRRRLDEIQAGPTPSLPRVDLEGQTHLEVKDPSNPGRIIGEVDRVENGALVEEKTARWAGNNAKWVRDHVDGQIPKYIEARQHMPGYEQAPITMRFTEPGVDPTFREAVEAGVAELRKQYPGVEIRVEWPE